MSSQSNLPTFTSSQIAGAFRIAMPNFQAWQRTGVLNLLDSEPTSMGKPRRFTVRDLYQIGIIHLLSTKSIRPREAAVTARRVVDAFDEFHGDQVQHVALSFFGDEPLPKVRIYGPETEEPLPADAVATLVVNLLPLFAHVKRLIDAATPGPTVRTTDDVAELVS